MIALGVLITLLCNYCLGVFYPTILLHGIGGKKSQLSELENYLKEQSIDVYNIEIGNGKIDSITMNMNKQCEIFAANIAKLNLETDFINIIGISQGGLTARCYVERYMHQIIRVNSLITLGTPHMGYFNPNGNNVLGLQYWKDPFNYLNYIESNKYLVPLNNENAFHKNKTYVENLQSLNRFIVIWSGIDNVIMPRESSRFEFYDIKTAETQKKLTIVPFIKSDIYKNDLIGLNYLFQQNKLNIEQFDCNHEEFKLVSCFSKIKNKQNTTLIEYILPGL
jgi:palmitoyl-protein thioesterase